MTDQLRFDDVHPAAVERFRPFAEAVIAACGDALESLHLTGSAVTPDFVPDRSDINSVVVLGRMDLEKVERLAPLGKKFGKRRVAAPLLMTPPYVRSSLDVFPLEFLNIERVHRTVQGEDIFRDLPIETQHLRLECEREIKVRLIGLRQGYLSSRGDVGVLNEEFARAISGYMPLFRGIARLYGETPAIAFDEVIDQLGRLTGIDTGSYRQVLDRRRSPGRLGFDTIKRLFEAFYAATEELGQVVDAMPS